MFFKGMERTQAIMDRMRGGLPFIRSTPSFIVLCVLPVVFDLYPIHGDPCYNCSENEVDGEDH